MRRRVVNPPFWHYYRESGEYVAMYLSEDATALEVFIDGYFARVLGVAGRTTQDRRSRALLRAREWQHGDELMVDA